VVKAYDELPKREGKFYYTDQQGLVIETTVTRASTTNVAETFGIFL